MEGVDEGEVGVVGEGVAGEADCCCCFFFVGLMML